MSKITDASFIAHQYTSVSRKVLEKANRYTLFENRLRSCPILPSVPHSGRYLDRSIGMAKQRPRASAWRSPTWRSPAACPKRRKARRRARHIPEPRTIPHLLPAGFPYFETSIAPAAFRSGLPSRSGPASFRSMRCNRRKPVTRHAPLPKAPKTLTPDRRPCAGRPRGRLPPR